MGQKFNDNARALLAGNITAAATSLAVESTKADRFPIASTGNWNARTDWFKAVIVNDQGAREVIYVGTRSAGNAALGNLQRGQENTTALAWNAGAVVVHGPLASDFQGPISGLFQQLSVSDGATNGAAFHFVNGILKLAKADQLGTIQSDQFTWDVTTGVLTCVDFALSSDARDKDRWKGLPKNFIQRLADVARFGTYRRISTKRRELGAAAQDLEWFPGATFADDKGELKVRYAQAALVAAIQLAVEQCEMRAELVDLRQEMTQLRRIVQRRSRV